MSNFLGYAVSVAPHCATGISLLKSERKGAQSKRFFCASKFMAGVTGALLSADPRICKANPVASATLSVSLDGGGSLTSEDSTMNNKVLTRDCAHSSLQLPTGETVLFDSADENLVSPHAWFNNGGGYACARIRQPNGTRKTVGMHQLILGFKHDLVDHINRVKLDNRRANLRGCSRRENGLNQVFDWPKQPNRSSIYKGVSRRGDRWQVVVRERGGKLLWLGIYATEEEAAAVAAPYFLPYQISP